MSQLGPLSRDAGIISDSNGYSLGREIGILDTVAVLKSGLLSCLVVEHSRSSS